MKRALRGTEGDPFLDEKVLLFDPVRDRQTCKAALDNDGATYTAKTAPVIPLRECSRRKTCRCTYIPLYPSQLPADAKPLK